MQKASINHPVPSRRGPRLLLLVYAASVVLVVLTAAALSQVVTAHLTATALDSSVEADRSLVHGFVRTLGEEDLTAQVSPQRAELIQSDLAALIDRNQILRIKVFAPDGTILYSDQRSLRGKNFGLSEELEEALEGRPDAELTSDLEGEEGDLVGRGLESVLEAYLPIQDASGRTLAVFEIYRDAAPVQEHIDATQRDVLLITLAAGAVLGLLLYLIFRAAQERISRQTFQLVESTRRDPLTGLLNHGTAVELLGGLLEQARAPGGGAVALALVDVDNFRLLNETHGHAAGDKALIQISEVLETELTEANILSRYGPDEFLVISPPETLHDLGPALERMRHRLADLSLQFGASERLPVTVSAGICHYPDNGDSASELLSIATVTLGQAKESGGDQIRVADAAVEELKAAERSTFGVLQGLVIAIDTKDRYTKRHSEDVARYAGFLAERIGLDVEMGRILHIAGLLHDVGKIGVPEYILRKPGPLDADEYGIMKQHVALGDMIVRDLPHLPIVRAGIRHHHERWDGEGYLEGLSGEQIPFIARVLAVADAFSAMTTTRPYRKALSVTEALSRLRSAAGTQLDPRLAEAFCVGIETAPDPPLPLEATRRVIVVGERRVA
jgi:diguanylate cyclase (GGDEF)-like protein